jgi:hypothetical protein
MKSIIFRKSLLAFKPLGSRCSSLVKCEKIMKIIQSLTPFREANKVSNFWKKRLFSASLWKQR